MRLYHVVLAAAVTLIASIDGLVPASNSEVLQNDDSNAEQVNVKSDATQETLKNKRLTATQDEGDLDKSSLSKVNQDDAVNGKDNNSERSALPSDPEDDDKGDDLFGTIRHPTEALKNKTSSILGIPNEETNGSGGIGDYLSKSLKSSLNNEDSLLRRKASDLLDREGGSGSAGTGYDGISKDSEATVSKSDQATKQKFDELFGGAKGSSHEDVEESVHEEDEDEDEDEDEYFTHKQKKSTKGEPDDSSHSGGDGKLDPLLEEDQSSTSKTKKSSTDDTDLPDDHSSHKDVDAEFAALLKEIQGDTSNSAKPNPDDNLFDDGSGSSDVSKEKIKGLLKMLMSEDKDKGGSANQGSDADKKLDDEDFENSISSSSAKKEPETEEDNKYLDDLKDAGSGDLLPSSLYSNMDTLKDTTALNKKPSPADSDLDTEDEPVTDAAAEATEATPAPPPEKPACTGWISRTHAWLSRTFGTGRKDCTRRLREE